MIYLVGLQLFLLTKKHFLFAETDLFQLVVSKCLFYFNCELNVNRNALSVFSSIFCSAVTYEFDVALSLT